MARVSTGKRLRFKVFERDNFTCQYCGKKPPEAVLHADHVFPVSKGGQTEIENLITACSDCNMGKNSIVLGSAPRQTKVNQEELQERFDQLKAFYKLQKKFSSFQEELIDEIDVYWGDAFPKTHLTTVGRSSFRTLLKKFSLEDIKEAIDITSARNIRQDNQDSRFRYMCGVLHNKKKQREQEEIEL